MPVWSNCAFDFGGTERALIVKNPQTQQFRAEPGRAVKRSRRREKQNHKPACLCKFKMPPHHPRGIHRGKVFNQPDGKNQVRLLRIRRKRVQKIDFTQNHTGITANAVAETPERQSIVVADRIAERLELSVDAVVKTAVAPAELRNR